MNKVIRWGLLFALIGIVVLFYFLDPAKNELFPRCIFHGLTGAYCPGCGSQRALHSLLHLNIGGVVSYNFLFLPAALLVIYHYAHPFLNKIFEWKLPNVFYLKNTPWIIFAVIVLFWIARNLPWYPFSVLAPG